jgi:hypothetical protein
MAEVNAVEHADRQVQRTGGQAGLLKSGKLEESAHWATLGAAS